MSDILASLVKREELHYVQIFQLDQEEAARRVYFAMLSNEVPIPLKSAVALIRGDREYHVAMFIGRTFRIPELPKPLDEIWSWQDYLERVGLPRQDGWISWPSKSFPGLERVIGLAVVADFFMSQGLKSQSYRCLACGETFGSYDNLFDKHIYNIAGHDKAFNAAVMARLPKELTGEGASPDEALKAARALLPPNAAVVSESATCPKTECCYATESGDTEGEAAERARKYFQSGERVMKQTSLREGGIHWLEMKLDVGNRASDEAYVAGLIRDQLRVSQFKGVPQEEISIRGFTCVQKGSAGFLGIGRKDGVYRVELQVKWQVRLDAELVKPAVARIRYCGEGSTTAATDRRQ